MKNTASNQSLQSYLWIGILGSFIGLSACSNETEDTAHSTTAESSEMTPVETSQDTQPSTTTSADSTESINSVDNTGSADTDNTGGTAYYSSTGGAEDQEKGVDAVAVNENNSNLDKTPAEGVQ